MIESEFDLHAFFEGRSFDAYEYFGAHPDENGCNFRVFAPAAKRVSLISSVYMWEAKEMKLSDGVWSVYLPGIKPGDLYKFQIERPDGQVIDHCDPYGFGMELRPNSASIVRRLHETIFTDSAWLEKRTRGHKSPINIYELYAGGFKHKNNTGDFPADWYNYEELADVLIPYLKENGYTHVEFMPLSEHPADASWGYQNTGFFAPTSRYGTVRQLQKLIDRLHENGIGAILDFVPVHFALDGYALSYFDGSYLYEYSSDDTGYSEWGTKNFNVTRGETASFLKSCANYWLTEYHFDGLRMDAISRAIYWHGDERRGVNDKAVAFLAAMNSGLHQLHPTAMLIAEDSTNFLKVTAPPQYGGLGFDYKWDLGWMNDTLDFLATPAFYRKWHYNKLSFSMMYFYSETFLLPFSHDENVHSKKTIVDKLWGSYEQKFSQCRALYLYLYTHPGKKLDFMGNEFAMIREFDEKKELDWSLLRFPMHDSFLTYRRKLHELYRSLPALWADDYHSGYFRWLMVNDADHVVYAYQRGKGVGSVMVILNLCDCDWDNYLLPAENILSIRELLNTDDSRFSGGTVINTPEKITAAPDKKGAMRLAISLRALSGRMFAVEAVEPEDLAAQKTSDPLPKR